MLRGCVLYDRHATPRLRVVDRAAAGLLLMALAVAVVLNPALLVGFAAALLFMVGAFDARPRAGGRLLTEYSWHAAAPRDVRGRLAETSRRRRDWLLKRSQRVPSGSGIDHTDAENVPGAGRQVEGRPGGFHEQYGPVGAISPPA